MSLERALEFMERVEDDVALQARLSALKGREAITGLCRIAAELGYAFSEEDYRAAVVERADGGLSEEAINEAVKEWGFPENPPA